jgi:hypothetical protein
MKNLNMMSKLLIISLLAGSLFMLYPNSVMPVRAYPDTIVDTFSDTQSLTQSGVGSSSATWDNAGILGGERDVVINVTSGGGNLTVDTNTSFPGQFSHSAGTGVLGTTTVVYDGDDSNALTLDHVGLGGIDLTANNNTALLLQIERDDLTGSIDILVYSDATSCSNLTMALPGAIGATVLPRSFLFFYNNFQTACANPADFTNVGAIQFLINDTGNDSLDLVIQVFAAVSVDFGDLDEISGNYNTMLADQGNGEIFGAGHVVSSLYLGSSVDSELDGQPNGNSDGLGDDQSTSDDENGVVPTGNWVAGSSTGGHVRVTVTGGDACLYGWIDWNRNGTFINNATALGSTANDRIIAQSVTSGVYDIDFIVPTAVNLQADTLNARFRLYPRDPGGNCWTGTGNFSKYPDRYQHYGGEVEDYTWGFGPTAITLQSATATPGAPVLVGLLAGVTLLAAGGLVVLRRRRA